MARSLSDILRRFRPAVAPGPAGPPGVPADRVAEREAELAVVFDALAPAVAAAGEERARGDAEADARRRGGLEEAAAILAGARARVEAMRAEAAAGTLSSLDAERARTDVEAQAEVERVRRVSAGRTQDVVDQVVAAVRATAGIAAGTPSADGRREVAR